MTAARKDQVYFKSLSLTNVRSFGEMQQLDMTDTDGRPAQWTLILGDNGVGKTTLLQCLASMRPILFSIRQRKTPVVQQRLPALCLPCYRARTATSLPWHELASTRYDCTPFSLQDNRFVQRLRTQKKLSSKKPFRIKNGDLDRRRPRFR